MKKRVVYFGSSHHSLPTLEALNSNADYELVAVVSQPDKPMGRKQVITPTPVSQWANEHGIELLTPKSWKKIDESIGENVNVRRLKELKPDFAVLTYYGRILPQSVIDVFPKGIVNIHPSLLPKYRGPTPGNMVIMNGDMVSGVSIMLLAQEQDAGPVLAQKEFEVSPMEIPETYYEKGFRIGTEVLMEVLPKYLSGELTPYKQDHNQATHTPLLSRDDGKIDWSWSVEALERKVRAFTPWPGTWTEVWEDHEGKLHFPQEMREKIGLKSESKDELDWNGVTKKRFKIISAFMQDGMLALDDVQIEGDVVKKFSELTY